MSDILVQKYQHYFNESVKLQETVNEQAAYIQELEEALIDLDEVYKMTPERADILRQERKKALRVQLKSASAESMSPKDRLNFDRSTARISRIDLLNMKTKNPNKRNFEQHPGLKHEPDEQDNPKKQLSDKALNKDLKNARKVEKKNS